MATPEDTLILVDRIEIVKAKTRSTINNSLPMLKDALHALERGKTHVTKDHIERVIDYLKDLKVKI